MKRSKGGSFSGKSSSCSSSSRGSLNLLNYLLVLILISLTIAPAYVNAIGGATMYKPALECYDPYNRPQKCMPEFINAAYQLEIEATNTCGEQGENRFCIQIMNSNQKNCEFCRYEDHNPSYLTDLHDPQNPTWWQSETIFEGIQNPNHVNLTLHLKKSYDITYVRILFRSPRPESFAIYKRTHENGPWTPYQYYSATCHDTYTKKDSRVIEGNAEAYALCTSEYSDISPLRDGEIAFSTLEGRPSGINFETSLELQEWVTATDIRITLDRLNTFGDEIFGDPQVLKSYFYAISDIAVGARCKCNGHASKCVASTGMNGERTLVCECRHNTDGPDCEKCLPLYNDVKWKMATSMEVNECKPCNCNGLADKCYFDAALFNLTGHGGHCLDCRENRDGPNCERCKENFYMREDGYCTSCNCDPVGSRSLQCNSNGQCQCKPGVTGDKCDRCAANFYHFGSHGCEPCKCDPRGSYGSKPSCDPNTGVCSCKENVEGRRCNECKPGFFNLDLDNRFGCTPCFCYGHTSECNSASGYSASSITSNFNRHKERWGATDLNSRDVEIKYNQYSKSIGTTAQGNEYVYFLAPGRFLGDQRNSYNKELRFKLQLVGQVAPSSSPSDIILEGAGTKVSLPIFAQQNGMPDQTVKEFHFRLHEHSDYMWQPSQSSRGFLSILSNLTAIKIRGTYSIQGEGILDDVELESAHKGSAGQPATWIEKCTCPEGYLGQYCESCAPGYRHSPAQGGPFMPCIPCNCNGHAKICEAETGRCICEHNTMGDNCDQCSKGFYGNALGGTIDDCKPCPCPDNGACMQINGDSVICTECPVGYFGARCEQCSDGYYGDPAGLLGEVQTCMACDCNGNVDPNAVGNCNRTTGECLKCIHNTAGLHCDQCLPGHFGNPLAVPHGQCDKCSCYAAGTEQDENGISQCDQVTGQCHCKANVIGRDCRECQPGFFNIKSGNGCEDCNCDPIGSYNSTCDRYSGQCFCKPGVVGQHCDQCDLYFYGFSSEGCQFCDCDESGSKGFQCDTNGQCPCNDNVEGKRCDRCKENKYDRHRGCLDCPDCYNLVQDAANEHRAKLTDLYKTLDEIARTPVSNDDEFEAKLKNVQDKVGILLSDTKYAVGAEGQSHVEILDDLHKRLDSIDEHLDKANELQISALEEIDHANTNYTIARSIIEEASQALQNALNLLQDEGQQALAKAKNKSDEFGVQSEQISDISREARAIADRLESEANFDLKNAKDAYDAAEKAAELARSAINLQENISNELRSQVGIELSTVNMSLTMATKASNESLTKANAAYDAALTLYKDVSELIVPEIDVKKLKKDAMSANEAADRVLTRVNDISNNNGKIFADFDDEKNLATVLVERLQTQKEDDIKLWNRAKAAFEKATKAVSQGDNTLKEANNTYHTLAGFQSHFKISSEKADLALQTVPEIENEIEEATDLINKAAEALDGANKNADEAKAHAQEAEVKYADQASKDAETIRKTANDTKIKARKLRDDADELNHRVQVTELKINELEGSSSEDDNIVDDAKRKVGQAKADTAEARKQIEESSNDIRAIQEELKNLKDIDTADLDNLENRLNSVEESIRNANLTGRIEKFREIRNLQRKSIDKYEKELDELKSEVNNIRLIAEALPSGCFSRNRLEP